MAVSEVLPNLNTGNVSGFDNTALFTQAASWQQAIKYFTLSEHIYQPALLIANKKWFDALTPELQKAVVNKGLEKLAKKGLKAIRALNPMVIENFKMAEVEVIKLTPEEKAAFKKKTRPAWDARLAKATKDGKRLFKAIMKAKKNK
jgi:TRAP-type C4-dicarboxylate transport system substrate-binding protein